MGRVTDGLARMALGVRGNHGGEACEGVDCVHQGTPIRYGVLRRNFDGKLK
jgi:hypothetical protein